MSPESYGYGNQLYQLSPSSSSATCAARFLLAIMSNSASKRPISRQDSGISKLRSTCSVRNAAVVEYLTLWEQAIDLQDAAVLTFRAGCSWLQTQQKQGRRRQGFACLPQRRNGHSPGEALALFPQAQKTGFHWRLCNLQQCRASISRAATVFGDPFSPGRMPRNSFSGERLA
ncbi:hypothetical protein MKZ38_000705 [Zalerion maritima]|uniref:Uncharacterized protein n=1 Tax=Zalerion maritima TaxID=339359 RepID=A0AAD5RSJ3_9PEZI|nr:hypothetical protein MKZ38_000705 [Zalerion maritima]